MPPRAHDPTGSVDPRRLRLVLVKLAVLLIVVVGSTLLLIGLGTALYGLASAGKEFTVDYGEIPGQTAAMLVSNVCWSIAAFSLTLLTRSMAGGITLSFAFLFVIGRGFAVKNFGHKEATSAIVLIREPPFLLRPQYLPHSVPRP